MKIIKETINNINKDATPVYDANLVLDAEIADERAEKVKDMVDPYEREKAEPFIGAEKQELPKEEEAKSFTESVEEVEGGFIMDEGLEELAEDFIESDELDKPVTEEEKDFWAQLNELD